MRVVTHHSDETMRLGMALAKIIKPGDIIFLQGGLGSGKTTFVRGVAEGLGGTDSVTSPTFMLLHLYKGKFPVYHFDFYRLQSVEEFQTLGLEEYLNGDGISLLEWPEKTAAFLHEPDFIVDFQFTEKQDERDVSIVSNDENRLKLLESAAI